MLLHVQGRRLARCSNRYDTLNPCSHLLFDQSFKSFYIHLPIAEWGDHGGVDALKHGGLLYTRFGLALAG